MQFGQIPGPTHVKTFAISCQLADSLIIETDHCLPNGVIKMLGVTEFVHEK